MKKLRRLLFLPWKRLALKQNSPKSVFGSLWLSVKKVSSRLDVRDWIGEILILVSKSLPLTSGLSGWDGHGCQSCVLLRVGRLVTGQYIWGGKVVGKIRLVGAIRVLVVQTLIWLAVALCCRAAAQLVSDIYYEEPELLSTANVVC